MASQDKPKRNWPISPRWRMALAGVLVAILAAGLWAWQRHATRVPSERESTTTSSPAHDVLATATARRAQTLSVPGLERGVPQLVPGLEKVRVGVCVSLTDDLCTIVFDVNRLKAPDSLYIADRPNVSSPFSKLRAIGSCNSPTMNSSTPSLSPDGLELLFKQGSEFSCARRESRSAEFGRPQPWPVPGVAAEDLRVARFISGSRVLISTYNSHADPRYGYLLADRADPNSAFSPPREISLRNCVTFRLCLRPDLLVGYGGWEKGLYVYQRKSEQEEFNPRVYLFDASVCGPVAGPIWVTPGEDVAFYCSAGPGNEPKGPKTLWMIRY